MKNIDVIVREAGLRDGLQIHPSFMPTESKIFSSGIHAATCMADS